MVEKTILWEGFNDKSSITFTSKGGVHSIENYITAEAKMAILMRRVDALEVKETPP